MSTASTDTTAWSINLVTTIEITTPQATLNLSINGGQTTPIKLKGVCYSPCPINGSNGSAPAIGDWFWDSFSGPGYNITDWSALWQRDLPNIRALGANTIRVYSMISRQINQDGTFPSPWNSGHLFTHQAFLDQCWNNGVNPIYVLVGIPLPSPLYWQSLYQPDSLETQFWMGVLQETAENIGTHPAVLGFVIENELDASNVTYCSCSTPPTNDCQQNAEFWWGQVEKLANIVKTAAPTKLVGIANHDDPFIAGEAASYMANCPSVDFWGVNTYQTQSFQTVFGKNGTPTCPTPGYAGLTGGALKAVIITEFGFPATSHSNPNDPSTIYADSTTIANTASYLNTMLPQAYTEPLNLGLYYFEFCDEWWNQAACQGWSGPPNICTWWGGCPASGFPNGYWDQEGFGLYSVSRGQGLNNCDPITVSKDGNVYPNTPIDVHTPRSATIAAIQAVFKSN